MLKDGGLARRFVETYQEMLVNQKLALDMFALGLARKCYCFISMWITSIHLYLFIKNK